MARPANRLLATALSISFLPLAAAAASGVSPYLPLNMSPEMERQIERVLILADRPVMSRPIAAARVLDALPAACKVDERLCRSVGRYLERYARRLGVGDAVRTGGREQRMQKSHCRTSAA